MFTMGCGFIILKYYICIFGVFNFRRVIISLLSYLLHSLHLYITLHDCNQIDYFHSTCLQMDGLFSGCQGKLHPFVRLSSDKVRKMKKPDYNFLRKSLGKG